MVGVADDTTVGIAVGVEVGAMMAIGLQASDAATSRVAVRNKRVMRHSD
jgi:hypothetical protein